MSEAELIAMEARCDRLRRQSESSISNIYRNRNRGDYTLDTPNDEFRLRVATDLKTPDRIRSQAGGQEMREAELIEVSEYALKLFQRIDKKADAVEDADAGSLKAVKWRELALHAECVSLDTERLCSHIRKLEGRR